MGDCNLFLWEAAGRVGYFGGELGIQPQDIFRTKQEVNSVGKNLVGEFIFKKSRACWFRCC